MLECQCEGVGRTIACVHWPRWPCACPASNCLPYRLQLHPRRQRACLVHRQYTLSESRYWLRSAVPLRFCAGQVSNKACDRVTPSSAESRPASSAHRSAQPHLSPDNKCSATHRGREPALMKSTRSQTQPLPSFERITLRCWLSQPTVQSRPSVSQPSDHCSLQLSASAFSALTPLAGISPQAPALLSLTPRAGTASTTGS